MNPAQVAEAVFDSHRFVKRLTEAGMEEGLAEVLAEEHMGPWIRNVATKADVAMIRKDLENAEANIRGDAATKTDVAMIRKDLENTEANIRGDAATKTDVAMIRKDLENTEANIRGDAATKTDVAMIRQDAENTQAMIRLDVEKRIAELRADLIKWMFGALMAQGALVVALIKLLP